MEKYIERIEKDPDLRSQFNSINKDARLDEDFFPLVLADNIVTKDLPTTCNSKALEGYQSPFESEILTRLKKRGGVLLGKAGVREFGVGSSPNQDAIYKLTQELDVLSIGSNSKGEAFEGAMAHGIYALVPSYGLITRHGIISVASSVDRVAIFSKDLERLGQALEFIQGKDEKDSCSFETEYEEYGSFQEIGGAKVALLDQVDFPLGQEFEIEGLDIAGPIYHILSSGEYASNMERYDGIGFGYRAPDYENLDQLYKNSRSDSLGLEVRSKILFGNFVLSKDQYRDYYDKALRARAYLADIFHGIFQDFEFIVSPYREELVIALGLAGLPALSTPGGRLVLTKAFNEKRLLDFVMSYQEELGGAK